MTLRELVKIMEALRGNRGCPWDKQQTRESLTPYIIEEAYELIEAIEENDAEKIKEELGDLLFQIIFQCQIAREKEEFNISDVIQKIAGKMIARHPHVFGNAQFETTDEVLSHWEVQKKREGKQRDSILEGVPKTLPSLLRAHRLQSRAAHVGFDWEKIEDALEQFHKEIKEFSIALSEQRSDKIADELGDLFFMLVNISRFVRVNPEDAMRKTINKFIDRFQYIEMKAASMNIQLSDMTLEQMDSLWDEAKEKES